MRFYYTNTARESAIKDIEKNIKILGESKELGYQSYRDICKYLNMLKDAIQREHNYLNKSRASEWTFDA